MSHICKRQSIVGGALVAVALFLAGFGCGYGDPCFGVLRYLPYAPAAAGSDHL